MSKTQTRHYLTIWYWLMALVVVSLAANAVLPKTLAVILIFTVAVIKATLVARHYMHLKNERLLIYAIALVPVAFVVILLVGLFPDFVYHLTRR